LVFLGSVELGLFGAMGAMGAVTGVSGGCVPKTSRVGNGNGKGSSAAALDDRRLKEKEGQSLKAVEEDVGELLSEWCGRALMQRTDAEEKGAPMLGLPDDVMTLVFARLPRQSLVAARLVCSSWKRVAEQQELASLRRKVNDPMP
jgi:hypothetical protein